MDTVKDPSTAHPPPNKEATCKKKFPYSLPFYSLLEDYIFSPHFGMTKWGRTVGFLEGDSAVTEGARTAVSGSLKRFSQAEIFNLLRENKAEDKKKLIIHRSPSLPPICKKQKNTTKNKKQGRNRFCKIDGINLHV